MSKRDIAAEYVRMYPDRPKKNIARILNEIYPETSIEQWRHSIRHVTGCNGERSRREGRPDIINHFIPPSNEPEYTPFVLNKHKRILMLCDIHVPYHDVSALKAVKEHCKKHDVDAILFNEAIDFYQISKFKKDFSRPSLSQEIDTFKWMVDDMREWFGDVAVYYKLGNHEERWEYFLWEHPEIQNIDNFKFDSILKSKDMGITVIDNQRIIKIGKLNVIHGHEFISGANSPVNPARGLYLKANEITACGHWHKTSEHTDTTINGNIITCWSIGCLCYLHPRYARLNKWNHGFAFIEVHSKDNFTLHNKRIYNGNVL